MAFGTISARRLTLEPSPNPWLALVLAPRSENEDPTARAAEFAKAAKGIATDDEEELP